jgi:hypothetical protein
MKGSGGGHREGKGGGNKGGAFHRNPSEEGKEKGRRIVTTPFAMPRILRWVFCRFAQ